MMFSPQHNVLIYREDPALMQPLLAWIEGPKILPGGQVAVPATLPNMQRLRKGSLPVVPPMELLGYDWPIRPPWKALAHQKTTANFMVLHPHSFIFNDMGTMKTLSALWAADCLMREAEERGEKIRAIVVAPLSILKRVWGVHIFDHFKGRRTYTILHGSADARLKRLKEDVDFYVINHDGLGVGVPSDPKKAFQGLARELLKRADIQIAIVDEASAYRIAATRRHRAARALIGSRPYLWLMSGTPTPNGPLDAHGLARLMGTTNESLKIFKDRVMVHVSQWRWVPRAGSAETAKAVLAPAIRFNSDFLELPPCTAEMREVPMSMEQSHAWNTLKKEAVLALRSGDLVHAVNEAALRIKLIQCAAGAIYDQEHKAHNLNPSARLAEVEAIVEETERKIVIFAPLTNVLELLFSRLTNHRREILNGAVPPRDRAEILRAFGDPENPLRILLADCGTTAHGINEMVSASVAIWYAPTDKNELYRQGNARINRPGQIGPTKVVQLVSSRLEREIYQRLDRNESLQGLVLKFAEGSLT